MLVKAEKGRERQGWEQRERQRIDASKAEKGSSGAGEPAVARCLAKSRERQGGAENAVARC